MCRFIDAEKATEANPGGFSVALMRRVMGINRSTYYAWLGSRPATAERQRVEDEPAAEIREIHGTSRGTSGAPRVHAALRRKGHAINRKKVERIMRERDIPGVTRRTRDRLTKQDIMADHHHAELVTDALKMAAGHGALSPAASCAPTGAASTRAANSAGR
ncbi:IS3 family transposase [Kitasatospora sp. NPDC087315]|uniref:IS3 family transposase n=1 Tax=Kitasatospora sp. NPDC087315 TaxID=3364069 RepID=UPI0038073E26